MKKTSLVLLLLIAAGCRRTTTPAAPADLATAAPPPLAPQISTQAVEQRRETAARNLTEEKLLGFLRYEQALLPLMLRGMEAVTAKYARDGGSGPTPLSGAELRAKAEEARAVALATSGLAADEIPGIAMVANEYYNVAYMEQRLEREAAHLVASMDGGADERPPVDVEHQVEQLKSRRQQIASKYPAETVMLLKKHEKEFIELREQRQKSLRDARTTKVR